MFVNVRDLPDAVRRAVESAGHTKTAIEVVPRESFHAASPSDGNRAIAVAVDLTTGAQSSVSVGSWGGANMFVERALDRGAAIPVPEGMAIVAGESGGRDNFFQLRNPGLAAD